MLVVDAGVAVAAAFAGNAFCELHDDDLVAPALRWSDARSTLRLRAWHGRVHPDDVEPARACLERCPVDRREPGELGHEAWRVADEMGWARTCDAEYVAWRGSWTAAWSRSTPGCEEARTGWASWSRRLSYDARPDAFP